MLAVFALSAVVHEYALAVCLSYFYPVLFVLFMFFGSEYCGLLWVLAAALKETAKREGNCAVTLEKLGGNTISRRRVSRGQNTDGVIQCNCVCRVFTHWREDVN